MTIRQEIVQAARLAPNLLLDSAGLVGEFVRGRMNPDGGFRGRSDRSDLYYTVFGIESLLALEADFPAETTAQYLRTFAEGESLDFVHTACLARCWANMPEGLLAPCERRRNVPPGKILRHIERYRSADGGYSLTMDAEYGRIYACFLALGAYQDLHTDMPARSGLVRCLRHLAIGDGGYANERRVARATTPATAAAGVLLRHLGRDVGPSLADWLLSRFHPKGGFLATPDAPIPDLLSTATALHALAGLNVSLDKMREPCLDFLNSLWSPKGGFQGSWVDDALDCEYTYYGLLALGHLSG